MNVIDLDGFKEVALCVCNTICVHTDTGLNVATQFGFIGDLKDCPAAEVGQVFVAYIKPVKKEPEK